MPNPADFADELDLLRRTPPQRLVADPAEVRGIPAPVVRRITDDPAAAAGRLADTMQSYWDLAFAEHWPRIRTLLEADVLWRANRLAIGGARALFDDLHESVTWQGDRLFAAGAGDFTGPVSGEGLLLVPSTMCWPDVRKMIGPYQSTIMYPVRGIATLWESGRPPVPAAIDALLGRTRAAMLVALAEPTSTTVLARRLAITPGGVSQHLSVLLGSGLVVRSRVGRSVLYRRTRSGDLLIASAG
ncbi:hypothetical protein HDA40_003864 [Hamadaea flava]|nr:hypothetical protein [Hamadaea flava]